MNPGSTSLKSWTSVLSAAKSSKLATTTRAYTSETSFTSTLKTTLTATSSAHISSTETTSTNKLATTSRTLSRLISASEKTALSSSSTTTLTKSSTTQTIDTTQPPTSNPTKSTTQPIKSPNKSPIPTEQQLQNQPTPIKTWKSKDFSKGLGDWNIQLDSYGRLNREYLLDPAGGSDIVMKVLYPAGSRNPANSPVGGTGFYAIPIDLSTATKVEFSYQLYVPSDFDWVKGGKLPGLYGGRRSCSGGNAALDCFSTRFMWRTLGLGEIYFYVPKSYQTADFCRLPPTTICNPSYGDSLGRGSFSLKPGIWNTIKQTIQLNTFTGTTPNADGIVQVYYGDGEQPVLEYGAVVYRIVKDVRFLGIDFETFFGGSDLTWVTPRDQSVYFKGFEVNVLS